MMDFDEQLEESHFVFTERKCRVCGKTKDLIDGFYLIRKNKSIQSSYSYECKSCTIQRVKSKKKVSIKAQRKASIKIQKGGTFCFLDCCKRNCFSTKQRLF